jgi:hypothetical protein
VFSPRLLIDACRAVPVDPVVGFSQALDLAHMMPEAGEPHFPVLFHCLPYPLKRMLQPFPALRPASGLLSKGSLRPAPFPPSVPPQTSSRLLCSPTSSVLRIGPTSRVRPSSSCPHGVHGADPPFPSAGQTRDLPVSVREVSRPALVPRPRGGRMALALVECILYCLPSAISASAPRSLSCFRGSIAWPAVSPVNASSAPSRTPSHDSGPV